MVEFKFCYHNGNKSFDFPFVMSKDIDLRECAPVNLPKEELWVTKKDSFKGSLIPNWRAPVLENSIEIVEYGNEVLKPAAVSAMKRDTVKYTYKFYYGKEGVIRYENPQRNSFVEIILIDKLYPIYKDAGDCGVLTSRTVDKKILSLFIETTFFTTYSEGNFVPNFKYMFYETRGGNSVFDFFHDIMGIKSFKNRFLEKPYYVDSFSPFSV
jgi:hypothetical protein